MLAPVGATGIAVLQGGEDIKEEQVRSQPWFVKAMGNPIVMGALGVIASKMLRR